MEPKEAKPRYTNSNECRIEWQVQRNAMMEILRVEMEESLLACLASDGLLTYFSSFIALIYIFISKNNSKFNY